MTMLPTTDYHDPEAILAAISAISGELEAENRNMPHWLLDLMQLLAGRATIMAVGGASMNDVGRWLCGTYILTGMLAEREGWPLAGDVAPALGTEALSE